MDKNRTYKTDRGHNRKMPVRAAHGLIAVMIAALFIFSAASIATEDNGSTDNWILADGGSFVPVANITGLPSETLVGVPLVLTGDVVPANATESDIIWSVKTQGPTGAAISGNTLSTTAAGNAVLTATVVGGARFAEVSTGLAHTLAIATDGSLWAWGSNGSGRLGVGSIDNKNVPVKVGTDNDWKMVSAGGVHSMAIKEDGSLWGWGESGSGLLGIPSGNHYTPTRVGTDNDWAMVSAGQDHNMAIKKDGSLWTWGNNWEGQLGTGDLSRRNVPTQVGEGYDWAMVSAGDKYKVAIKKDGSLWAWGKKSNSRLASGNAGLSAS
jgi:hypothetical protein